MRDTKFFIAAGIFLAMTLIKLLLPGVVYDMRDEIAIQIDKNIDYNAVVATFNRQIDEYVDRLDFLLPSEAADVLPSPESEITATLAQETPTKETPITTDAISDESAFPTVTPTTAGEQSAILQTVNETLPFEYIEPIALAVSSGFGERIHPIEGVEKFHYGIDLAAQEGDSIYAFADGEVVTAELSDSYGNYIVVRHDEVYSTVYAHCSELLVKPGDKIYIGQEIARVGHTGNATGPHLHFELRKNNVCIDPEAYLC